MKSYSYLLNLKLGVPRVGLHCAETVVIARKMRNSNETRNTDHERYFRGVKL